MLSLLPLLMGCGVIFDLSLLSLSRISNLNKIRSWTVEILAVHVSSLYACTHVPNVIPRDVIFCAVVIVVVVIAIVLG